MQGGLRSVGLSRFKPTRRTAPSLLTWSTAMSSAAVGLYLLTDRRDVGDG